MVDMDFPYKSMPARNKDKPLALTPHPDSKQKFSKQGRG